MKTLLAFLGIAASGISGYMFEPQLRFKLTGKESTKVVATAPEEPAKDEPTAPVTEPAKAEPTFDYSALQPSQLPEKVVLKASATATAPGETDSLALSPGTKVTPVRIEGENLVFRVIGAAEGTIPVAQTNLVEILVLNPPPAPAVVEPEPQPEPEPAPQPEPEPEPQPEAPVAQARLDADGIVALMKKNLGEGKISEFTVDQVSDWKAAEEETIDGQAYQVGTVSYKAETIFGVKELSAKALIKEGNIVRWISPTSGLEIK
jgi:hypothetical protein